MESVSGYILHGLWGCCVCFQISPVKLAGEEMLDEGAAAINKDTKIGTDQRHINVESETIFTHVVHFQFPLSHNSASTFRVHDIPDLLLSRLEANRSEFRPVEDSFFVHIPHPFLNFHRRLQQNAHKHICLKYLITQRESLLLNPLLTSPIYHLSSRHSRHMRTLSPFIEKYFYSLSLIKIPFIFRSWYIWESPSLSFTNWLLLKNSARLMRQDFTFLHC